MRKNALLVLAGLAFLGVPRTHAAEGPGIRLTVLGGMERIGQDQEPYGLSAAETQAARSEWESFQVVVSAPRESISVTEAEITDLDGQHASEKPV